MLISRASCAALFLFCSQFANAQCSTAVTTCNLVWSDEFDGNALDTTKWEYLTGDGSQFGIPGWGNNEKQWYTTTNAEVANGQLTIIAKEEASNGYAYTSSRIRTLGQGDWTYGRFEMRAKLPANQGASGQGTWPAFWMLPSDLSYGVWPASGEIDIMEWLGHQPSTIHGTLHYGNAGQASTYNSSVTNLPSGTTNDFHTYAVEWDPNEIRWYLDGNLYKSVNFWFSSAGAYPAPFDVSFHLILNMAIGGYFPGDPNNDSLFPQEFVVDYVRVYATENSIITEPTNDITIDNFEHGDPNNNGWFAFSGNPGGGGIDANSSDTHSQGGNFSMQSGWGSGGTAGWFGGFGTNKSLDLGNIESFSFWINPDSVDGFGRQQDFSLELNIQDDDNGDNIWQSGADDEFQFVCRVSATGPCALTGGGWQQITIPIEDFIHDTSFATGGNGVLDTEDGGNGRALVFVTSVISHSGADVTFRTDDWIFNGIPIVEPVNVPLPWAAFNTLAISLITLGGLSRQRLKKLKVRGLSQ